MLNYRNEAAFSSAIVKELRSKLWFVQRIESGTTGRGIPDIYAIAPNRVPFWLELKRIHSDISHAFKVPWRPGQQPWMYKASRYGQRCYTIIAFNNGIMVLQNNIIYTGDIVDLDDEGIQYHLCKQLSAAIDYLSRR